MVLNIQLGMSCSEKPATSNSDVQVVESDHFTFLLYDGLSQSLLAPIQSKLDENYLRVLSDLDVSTMDKVSVRIWNNETNFLDNMESSIGRRYTGASGWVYSSTDVRVLYRGDYTSQIALHEFCHAVSLVVNNQIGNNPRWLWEAIAIYEAGEFVNPKTISYLVSGSFPTMVELNSDFNSGGNKIYSVGYLLSEYIISSWNRTRYINLIKSNGNIQQTLEITTQQFEVGWKNFVIAKYLNR
jgi:hypothetical protein